MRIGSLWFPNTNAVYRAHGPLREMARRGHYVYLADFETGRTPFDLLCRCDVVHVYRTWDDDVREQVRALSERGVAVVYDNDDDYTLVHRDAHSYRDVGGIKGERIARAMLRMARQAQVVTTTSEPLAERYRAQGLGLVRVVPNQLAPEIYRPTNRHDGVRVGWVAGGEHQSDANALDIPRVLERLLDEHPEMSVETFGLNLRIPSTKRYEHRAVVPFGDLPRSMARWDIGIAPLADIPFNRMRSDIKIKEYAGSGLAWLASPVAPYLGFGERQGGRLVADDAWYEALERLIRRDRERRRLQRRALKWSRTQTIAATGEQWERAFELAIELRRSNAAPVAHELSEQR